MAAMLHSWIDYRLKQIEIVRDAPTVRQDYIYCVVCVSFALVNYLNIVWWQLQRLVCNKWRGFFGLLNNLKFATLLSSMHPFNPPPTLLLTVILFQPICFFSLPPKKCCKVSLTVLVLVMGTSANNISHVLRLLVHGSSPEYSTLRRLLAHQHLNGTGLCQLTVQFVEHLWVLQKKIKIKSFVNNIFWFKCSPKTPKNCLNL